MIIVHRTQLPKHNTQTVSNTRCDHIGYIIVGVHPFRSPLATTAKTEWPSALVFK